VKSVETANLKHSHRFFRAQKCIFGWEATIMRKSLYLLAFLLFFCDLISVAQSEKEKDLVSRYNQASSDTSRINAMNNLADYYYRNQFIRKGDSISNVQSRLAEIVNDPKLLIKTYFDNAAAGITDWTTRWQFEKVASFIQQGIEHAKKVNNYDYVVFGYARLSAVLRKRGKYNEALTAAMFALNNAIQQAGDSAKAVANIEVGNYYLSRKEFTLAATNYNTAFELAVKNNNPYLKTDIQRCLANLNDAMEQYGKAKDYLLDCIHMDKEKGYREGLLKDYLAMGRLTGDEYYLNEAITLANSYQIEGYTLKAKELLLAVYLNKQDNEKALSFLNSQPQLRDYYMRDAIEDYYYERGTIHLWTNKPDSALPYFLKTESYMMSNYDVKTASNVYLDIGDCYSAKGELPKAIEYYLKALNYFQQKGEVNLEAFASKALAGYYSKVGNYERAYFYKEHATGIQDSLSILTKNAEVALLNVDRLDRQEKEELRQKLAADNRNRNLQYMSITIAICLVFVGMLVLGMFPISRLTIKLLGYFFFISLFEFIVLLLDNNILHTITHGEPLKLWLIKIVLIGMLVPIQHFLEHGITKFLSSRQLLKARKKFSLKTLWTRKKTKSHKRDADTEELENDTAVL